MQGWHRLLNASLAFAFKAVAAALFSSETVLILIDGRLSVDLNVVMERN